MDHPTSPGAPGPSHPRSTLEAAGWRCTRQRAAVFERLRDSSEHPTAEELYRGVKPIVPSISLATVYKALEALVGCGLATKLVAANGSARYDGRGDHHYHPRCLRSGSVEDVPTRYDPDMIAKIDPELDPRLRTRGFRVTGCRLALVGFYEELAPEPEAAEGS